MDFANHVAVVTGAAAGMGAAGARALADAGAHVYAVDLRQEALDAAWSGQDSVTPVALDVSDSAAIQSLFERVEQEQGRLDVLVNAAGVATPNREKQAWVDGINNEMLAAARQGEPYHPDFLSGVTDEDFDRVLAINLSGTFYMIRAAAPLLKRNGGSIINFASVAGLMGLPMPAYYPASKAAVVGMTKALAAELAPSWRSSSPTTRG